MTGEYVKVASHGLIQKDNKFLVIHRSSLNDYKPNLWDLPGGTIEFGEHPIDALIREIDEETKTKVKVGNLIFVYDFVSGEKRHQFQMVFTCDYLSGEVILNPREHQDFKWVTLEEMEQLPKIAFLEELIKFLKNNEAMKFPFKEPFTRSRSKMYQAVADTGKYSKEFLKDLKEGLEDSKFFNKK